MVSVDADMSCGLDSIDIYSLEDGFRSSVLSKYIENSEPNPELYRVFMRVYIASDYGFGNFSEKVIEKVSLGKSEEQKEKTAKKLKDFSNEIKIYRGEGKQINTLYKSVFLDD